LEQKILQDLFLRREDLNGYLLEKTASATWVMEDRADRAGQLVI
jgi:hypothetical protein